MTIKHIRWGACIGLSGIIGLKEGWAGKNYKLNKERKKDRSKEGDPCSTQGSPF